MVLMDYREFFVILCLEIIKEKYGYSDIEIGGTL